MAVLAPRRAAAGRVGRKLSWQPPALTNPTVVDVPTTFYSGTFGDTEDVALVMPSAHHTSSFTVTGGRHVRIVGGSVQLPASQSGTSAMRFLSQTGSIYLEGLLVDTQGSLGNQHDAIDVSGSASAPYTLLPDVYLQNMRIVGVMGSNAGNHADVLQPQGSIGTLYVDRLTGRSNYQGLFLSPQKPITAIKLRHVDLSYETGGDPTTYLLWFYDAGSGTFVDVPTTLLDVFATPRAAQTLGASGIWPVVGAVDGSSNPIGAVLGADGASYTWPALTDIKGSVGVGPRGLAITEFVPSGAAGLGYVPPGFIGVGTPTYDSAVSTSVPFAYFPFDANGNDTVGPRTGTPTAMDFTQAGRHGLSGAWNGTTSLVTIPDDSALRLNNSFSIEFWAYMPTAASGFPGIIRKGPNTAGNFGYQIFADASTNRWTFKRNNTQVQSAVSAIVRDTWQHWVFRFNSNGNGWAWYRNGQLSASSTNSSLAGTNSDTTAVWLGKSDTTSWNGRIDGLALYSRVLLPSEVAQHYAAR